MGDTEVQEALPADEGAQETPKVVEEQPKADEMPAWAKTLQGQFRRSEQEANSLREAYQALLRQAQPQPVGDDPYTGLLEQLPEVKPLVTDLRKTQAELREIRLSQQRESMSAQERATREYTFNELRDLADALEVDFSAVEKNVTTLSTEEMWAEGKKLIRQAKKSPAPADESKIRADERTKILQERGVYGEQRTSSGSRPRTKAEMEEAHIAGDVSAEEYAAWRKANP